MASPLPPEDNTPFGQGMAALSPEEQSMVMSGLNAARNFDLGAYQAQFQKTQAAQDAALKAAQATGLSDQYTQLYGGADIIPGMTQGILSNLGIENPYLPVYTLRGTANKGGDSANERMSFAPLPGMEYRLVDKNTGQVTTASTPQEIKALAEAANVMGQTGGPMANYAIESGQGGKFTTMFEDTPDISKFDRLAGTALPIAVSLIPGLQGVGAVLANAGASAAGAAIAGGDPLKGAIMGGLSAAGGQYLGPEIQGVKNAAGQTVATNLGRSVGTAIGSTVGGIATGKPIDKALLGGAIAGGTTYLGGELMGGGPKDNSLQDWAREYGIYDMPAQFYEGPAALAEGFNPINFKAPSVTGGSTGYSGPSSVGASFPSGITVTGTRVTPSYTPSYTPSFTVGGLRGTEPKSDYVVTAQEKAQTPSLAVPVGATTGPNIDVTAIRDLAKAEEARNGPVIPSDYTVTAQTDKPAVKDSEAVGGPYIPVGAPKSDYTVTAKTDKTNLDGEEYKGNLSYIPGLVDDIAQEELAGKKTEKPKDTLDKVSDYLQLAGLASTVIGLLGGGGGGKGTAGRYSSSKNLPSTFSAKLPTPGQGGAFQVGGLGPRVGGAAGTYAARPVTDWYRYGMGRAMDIPEGMDLSGATSPYAGYGPGTLGQETFRRVTGNAGQSPLAVPRRELLPNMVSSLGRDATLPQIESALAGAKTAEEATKINPGTVYFNIDAGTAKALGDPSLVGTVMSIQDLQRRMAARPMSHGGSMGYARGSDRDSFAVEGPGTGRSDDIPAVLSDGEYVIDAETVALLGDGSSKAGAKKLDEMRVKVRKHKGKNLAKGKFSVDAKRPEKYMFGGRI